MTTRFMENGAGFEIVPSGSGTVLRMTGLWTVAHLADLDAPLRTLEIPPGQTVRVDVSEVERMDTVGAWLVDRTCQQIADAGSQPDLMGGTDDQDRLIERVRARYAPCDIAPPMENPWIKIIERVGRTVDSAWHEFVELIAFTGQIMAALGRVIRDPRRFRFTSFMWHMEEAGFNALPIISLMSFLIGAVLAYLGSDILATFGAQVFTVNLIAFAVLREFGVLLTAIMIAGRSGSAFTAQIGSMKGREEIDAMRTLGLDPIDLLVLPRVLALVVCAPLLTVIANFMGLFGGGIVSWLALDITPGLYLTRLSDAIALNFFWAGLIKAPFFAFLVAMIGCYQGLQVGGSAESVGQRTTKSVVEGIFLVIIADALFAMFFVEIGF